MWTSDTQLAPPLPLAGASKRRRHGLSGDDRLARLVAEGDEQAFATLYHRYYQRLYRYCRSLLHNDADAQDALQAAWTGAYTALREGRRDAPMRPWLYRIAHNESVSIMRRRRPDVSLLEANETPTASAEQLATERARLALLMSDLRALTERQRGALVMRELGGLTHEEIAVAFGISGGAAKQTLFEARASLAEFQKGRDMACEDVCRAVSDGNGRTLRGRQVRAHLRDCASCSAFAAAIPARSRDLRAIAPPISIVAATSLLRRAVASGSGHGGASTTAASTTAAGAATTGAATTGVAGTGTATTSLVGGATAAGAVTKVAGIAISAKTIAGIVVLATAAAGITGAAVSNLGANTSQPLAKPKLHLRPVAPARPSGRGHHAPAAAATPASPSHASRATASGHVQASAGKRHAGQSTGSAGHTGAVRTASPSHGKSTAAKASPSTPAASQKPVRPTSTSQPARQSAHQPQRTKTAPGSTRQTTSPATHGSGSTGAHKTGASAGASNTGASAGASNTGASAGASNTGASQPPASSPTHPKPAGA